MTKTLFLAAAILSFVATLLFAYLALSTALIPLILFCVSGSICFLLHSYENRSMNSIEQALAQHVQATETRLVALGNLVPDLVERKVEGLERKVNDLAVGSKFIR